MLLYHSTFDARMLEEHSRTLRMPIVGASFAQAARKAVRAHQTPVSLLAALLQAEVEERERGTIDRQIKDARLPRFKTLDEFDFAAAAPLLSCEFVFEKDLENLNTVSKRNHFSHHTGSSIKFCLTNF